MQYAIRHELAPQQISSFWPFSLRKESIHMSWTWSRIRFTSLHQAGTCFGSRARLGVSRKFCDGKQIRRPTKTSHVGLSRRVPFSRDLGSWWNTFFQHQPLTMADSMDELIARFSSVPKDREKSLEDIKRFETMISESDSA